MSSYPRFGELEFEELQGFAKKKKKPKSCFLEFGDHKTLANPNGRSW